VTGLLLAVTLLAQSSPAPPPAVINLAFASGVEDFVIAASPGHRPPEPYRSLFDRLGSPLWAEREAASKRLEVLSADDQRWLLWGRRSRDPEVVMRCNAILRRLNPCPNCKGSGESKNWYEYPCSDCLGIGTVWLWSPWD
jgi:hypothetical protein